MPLTIYLGGRRRRTPTQLNLPHHHAAAVPFTPQNLQVAYHEAGHAVLGHITGIYQINGPIVTAGMTKAWVSFHCNPRLVALRARVGQPRNQADLVREQAIIGAAGVAAEHIHLRNMGVTPNSRALFRGAHGDVLAIRQLVGPGHFNQLVQHAECHLADPRVWAMVEDLVQAITAYSGFVPGYAAAWTLERSRRHQAVAFRILR
ncbi:hypothetical protein [Microvirga zambiensis]|uniref:hypothetical protein n=1 Tax=Microvirga zambiensis TaxID=1402137 RepID=UPI00191D112B|nr:hypothetical protein [Microvirga zambiensis]